MRILVSGATRTMKRLKGQYADNLGVLLTPLNGNAISRIIEWGLPWAIDNGAFSSKGFQPDAFLRLLDKAAEQPNLLWVAVPDVVADAKATNRLFWQWQDKVVSRGLPVAYVCQDGCEAYELPGADCYFLGGTTRWKLSQDATDVVLAAREMGKQVHMGRVNTLTRIEAAIELGGGVDSIDGTAFSRYPDTYLERAIKFIRNTKHAQRDIVPDCDHGRPMRQPDTTDRGSR